MKSVFEDRGEPVPKYVRFDQGSYKLGTGIKPLDGDIDVGLRFDLGTDDEPDPVIESHFSKVYHDDEWAEHLVVELPVVPGNDVIYKGQTFCLDISSRNRGVEKSQVFPA